jgi:hypothetical protein
MRKITDGRRRRHIDANNTIFEKRMNEDDMRRNGIDQQKR